MDRKDGATVFPGSTEMARRLNAFDWSQSPLGPVERWPDPVRQAVRLLLPSRVPMFVWVGPQLISLYNDAYIEVLGAKHPRSLGQPAARLWAEIWDVVGPMADTVINGNTPTFSEDLRLLMQRSDLLEETFFTFSYSPLYDEAGAALGLFCACYETTAQVVGGRRLRALSGLGEALLDVASNDTLDVEALAVLAAFRADLPAVALLTGAGAGAGAGGNGAMAPTVRLATGGLERFTAIELMALIPGLAYRAVSSSGAITEPSGSGTGPAVAPSRGSAGPGRAVHGWPVPTSRLGGELRDQDGRPIETLVALPLQPSATADPAWLVFALNPTRPFDAGYRAFLDLVTRQLETALHRVSAQELERRRITALEALDRAKSTFFSNVSHELRTPLTLITSPLEQALGDEVSVLGPPHRQRVDLARRNATRLAKLVNSLLEMSRVSAGHSQPQPQLVDLAQLTGELVGMFASAFAHAGLSLRADIGPRPLLVTIDPDMWERVVLNLVSNALKYTLSGTVSVRLSTDGGEGGEGAVLTVADTGVGIAAEDLPRLFERFHRVAQPLGRTIEGVGLGLSLTREILTLLGGGISVRSQPGVGSTFTVTVPRGTPVEVRTAETRHTVSSHAGAFLEEALLWLDGQGFPEDATPPGTGPVGMVSGDAVAGELDPRVLIVEDNADLRAYLARTVGSTWPTRTAANGAEGLALIRQWRPQVVVCDVMMPVMDGLSLLAEVRADQSISDTAIILLSARAGPEARSEGMVDGADDYLDKPFSLPELMARVGNRLESVRARRQRADLAEAERVIERAAGALGQCASVAALASVVATVTEPLGVRAVAIHQLDAAAGVVRVQSAHGVPGESLARFAAVPLSALVPPTACIRTGEEIRLGDLAEHRRRFPRSASDMAAHGGSACLTMPLVGAGRVGSGRPPAEQSGSGSGSGSALGSGEGVVGCLSLLWPVNVRFEGPLLESLRRLGRLVAHTLDRLERAETERAIARALQQELLRLNPRGVPLAVASAYLTQSDQLFIGGDWYDVIPLVDGRVTAAVGDVVGSGLPAATVMGQLRAATTMVALSSCDPGDILRGLDRMANREPAAFGATMACLTVDPVAERFGYSIAGHPPPLMVDPMGRVHFLGADSVAGEGSNETGRSSGSGWPLGVSEAERPAPVRDAPFPAGSLLVLYTDGLVERRRENIDDGLARLAEVVSRQWFLPVPLLADEIVRQQLAGRAVSDDAALMLLRSPGASAHHFADVIPSSTEAASASRARLRAWLEHLAIPEDARDDFLLAVHEAVVNAVCHASRLDVGLPVAVEAAVVTDHGQRRLVASVTDVGDWADEWRDRTNDQGGRGLLLMRALVTNLDVRAGSGAHGGTTVVLSLTLEEPDGPARPRWPQAGVSGAGRGGI